MLPAVGLEDRRTHTNAHIQQGGFAPPFQFPSFSPTRTCAKRQRRSSQEVDEQTCFECSKSCSHWLYVVSRWISLAQNQKVSLRLSQNDRNKVKIDECSVRSLDICSLDVRLVGVFRPEWGSNILAQGRVQRRNVAKRRPGYRKAPIVALKGQNKLRPSIMDGPCDPFRAICIVLGGAPGRRFALPWAGFFKPVGLLGPSAITGWNQRP